MALSLATLRTRAKRRADRESSTFVADAEWNDYINVGLSELHDLLVTTYEDYVLKSTTITLVAGTSEYSLPSDFYKARGIDYPSGGLSYSLKPFMFRERNRYQLTPGFLIDPVIYTRYQLVGNKVRFVPTPGGAATLTLWYVPQATTLSLDADTIDVAYVNGWEEFVVVSAAIRALMKEESDVSALMAEKGQTAQRIQSAAPNRDSSEPLRVVDVSAPEVNWLWR